MKNTAIYFDQTRTNKCDSKVEKFPRLEIERELKLKRKLEGKVFDRVKFKENIYAVGDIIQVRILPSYEISVAKIVRIIHSNSLLKYSYWPMIEVDWMYQKKDLMDLGFIRDLSWIGSYEVFESNHKDYIFIESILKKVQLLSLEEYQNLEVIDEGVYFTRGKIDILKVSFLKFICSVEKDNSWFKLLEIILHMQKAL